jgi:hypothetical protein
MKTAIDASVEVEPGDVCAWLSAHGLKTSPQDNFSIGLNCDRLDYCIGVPRHMEGGVHGAIGVEAQENAFAAEEDLAICLNGHGICFAECLGSESRVQTAVGVQACEPRSWFSAQRSEIAGDQDLSITLRCKTVYDSANRTNLVNRSEAESIVHAAIGVQAGDVCVRRTANAREVSSNQNLSIGLKCDSLDRSRHVRIKLITSGLPEDRNR